MMEHFFYGMTSLRLRQCSFSQIPKFFNKRYSIVVDKTFGPVKSKPSGQDGTKVEVGGSIGWGDSYLTTCPVKVADLAWYSWPIS